MPKKRKSDSAGLEDIERSLFSTFCTAANSISQLYTLAHNQQRAGFLAGQRHALIRLQQWLEAGSHPGPGSGGTTFVSREKLLDFIQGELDCLDESLSGPLQWHAAGPGGVPVAGAGSSGPRAHADGGRPELGSSGIGPSHILSQLHQCHIRPRDAVGDGVPVSGTPSESRSWESLASGRPAPDSGALPELRIPSAPACPARLTGPQSTQAMAEGCQVLAHPYCSASSDAHRSYTGGLGQTPGTIAELTDSQQPRGCDQGGENTFQGPEEASRDMNPNMAAYMPPLSVPGVGTVAFSSGRGGAIQMMEGHPRTSLGIANLIPPAGLVNQSGSRNMLAPFNYCSSEEPRDEVDSRMS